MSSSTQQGPKAEPSVDTTTTPGALASSSARKQHHSHRDVEQKGPASSRSPGRASPQQLVIESPAHKRSVRGVVLPSSQEKDHVVGGQEHLHQQNARRRQDSAEHLAQQQRLEPPDGHLHQMMFTSSAAGENKNLPTEQEVLMLDHKNYSGPTSPPSDRSSPVNEQQSAPASPLHPSVVNVMRSYAAAVAAEQGAVTAPIPLREPSPGGMGRVLTPPNYSNPSSKATVVQVLAPSTTTSNSLGLPKPKRRSPTANSDPRSPQVIYPKTPSPMTPDLEPLSSMQDVRGFDFLEHSVSSKQSGLDHSRLPSSGGPRLELSRYLPKEVIARALDRSARDIQALYCNYVARALEMTADGGGRVASRESSNPGPGAGALPSAGVESSRPSSPSNNSMHMTGLDDSASKTSAGEISSSEQPTTESVQRALGGKVLDVGAVVSRNVAKELHQHVDACVRKERQSAFSSLLGDSVWATASATWTGTGEEMMRTTNSNHAAFVSAAMPELLFHPSGASFPQLFPAAFAGGDLSSVNATAGPPPGGGNMGIAPPSGAFSADHMMRQPLLGPGGLMDPAFMDPLLLPAHFPGLLGAAAGAGGSPFPAGNGSDAPGAGLQNENPNLAAPLPEALQMQMMLLAGAAAGAEVGGVGGTTTTLFGSSSPPPPGAMPAASQFLMAQYLAAVREESTEENKTSSSNDKTYLHAGASSEKSSRSGNAGATSTSRPSATSAGGESFPGSPIIPNSQVDDLILLQAQHDPQMTSAATSTQVGSKPKSTSSGTKNKKAKKSGAEAEKKERKPRPPGPERFEARKFFSASASQSSKSASSQGDPRDGGSSSAQSSPFVEGRELDGPLGDEQKMLVQSRADRIGNTAADGTTRSSFNTGTTTPKTSTSLSATPKTAAASPALPAASSTLRSPSNILSYNYSPAMRSGSFGTGGGAVAGAAPGGGTTTNVAPSSPTTSNPAFRPPEIARRPSHNDSNYNPTTPPPPPAATLLQLPSGDSSPSVRLNRSGGPLKTWADYTNQNDAPSNAKTKGCVHWETTGKCRLGDACNFLHLPERRGSMSKKAVQKTKRLASQTSSSGGGLSSPTAGGAASSSSWQRGGGSSSRMWE
ncbi:unnamed protein product [Amoebophrya sp. A120]|nr:unnamed protein product [Amoebophrya sp. A120]|eukprot:GSA120T00018977001.1